MLTFLVRSPTMFVRDAPDPAPLQPHTTVLYSAPSVVRAVLRHLRKDLACLDPRVAVYADADPGGLEGDEGAARLGKIADRPLPVLRQVEGSLRVAVRQ